MLMSSNFINSGQLIGCFILPFFFFFEIIVFTGNCKDSREAQCIFHLAPHLFTSFGTMYNSEVSKIRTLTLVQCVYITLLFILYLWILCNYYCSQDSRN